MIEDASIVALIRDSLPDARVEIVDWSSFGTRDHFNITVRSRAFAGKPLIDQHRMVYDAIGAALKDGRIHAAQLKTIAED